MTVMMMMMMMMRIVRMMRMIEEKLPPCVTWIHVCQTHTHTVFVWFCFVIFLAILFILGDNFFSECL
jgi:hypothetical protein